MKTITETNIPSPCWLLDEKALRKNLKILKQIKDESGAKILLALKGFALWKSFDIIRETLDGCCASGLNEAKLAHEEFQKELHTYSPAFKESEIDTVASISHHLVFNSPDQFHRFLQKSKRGLTLISHWACELTLSTLRHLKRYTTHVVSIRASEQHWKILIQSILQACDGLHFHALCEQDCDALEGVSRKF